MTVNSTDITSGPYAGDGINDAFNYNFKIFNETQIAVFETDSSSVQTELVVGVDYTLSGVGDDSGGVATRVAGPLPVNYEWYIIADYKFTQLTAFDSQGGFFPKRHEDAFDKLTFLVQQVLESTGVARVFRLAENIVVDGTFTIAETALQRANKLLAFNSGGSLFTTSPPSVAADVTVESMSDVLLIGSFTDGQVINFNSFHAGDNKGGGKLVYDSLRDTADHDGITVIDWRNTADLGLWTPAEQAIWFTAVVGNIGCLIRSDDGPINLLWSGAKGVETGNDTAPVNATFAYADSFGVKGAKVYIPTGRYPVTAQVTCLGVNIEIFGDGDSSVIISKLTAPSPAVYIGDLVSAIRGFRIHSLRITGEWVSAAGNGGGAETALLECNECLEGQVDHCRIDFSSAIGLKNGGGEMFQASFNTLRNNATDGMVHDVAADATAPPLLRFLTNMVKDNGDSGLRIIAAAGHVVKNNVFEGHDTGGDEAGIVCLTSATRIKDNKFEGNTSNILVGDTLLSSRVAVCEITSNRFSLGVLDFRRYSNCITKKNTFINGASVVFGADEANKYSFFDSNLIALADITNSATDGKIVITNVIEGSTSDLQVTFTDGDTTPDVTGADVFRTSNTGATSITNFEFGYTGKVIKIIAGDVNTTIVDGSLINTSTGNNIVLGQGDILLLHADSGPGGTNIPVWKDVGFWPAGGVTNASSGVLTMVTGSVNPVTNAGLYEVAPGIWVPYITNPAP